MVSKKNNSVPKPTDECLGDWIVNDVMGIRDFFKNYRASPFQTTMKEYEYAWYATGDLMFKNEDDCHFRMVAQDMMAYCNATEEPKKKLAQQLKPIDGAQIDTSAVKEQPKPPIMPTNCNSTKILTNIQKNAFGLIT